MSETAAIETIPNRIEWLKARRSSIGASEAAAILGLHPYHSPLSLYYEKTTETEPTEEQTDYQEWGHLLETPLASKYARVTKREVLTVENPGQPFIHKDFSFVTASPDRFFRMPQEGADHVLIRGPLELKTADRFERDEELPIHWQVQVQQQMAVLGLQCASFAILGPFRKFYTADIRRNDAFIQLLIEKIDEFWHKHILARVPPPADGHTATTEALKRLYPKDTGARIEVPAEFETMWNKREELRLKAKEMESEQDLIENRIKATIADATYGVLPDGTGFSMKTTDRVGYTVDPCSYRTLRRVKKIK